MARTKYLMLLLAALSLTSCATIVSRKTYTARIYSDAPEAEAKIYDSVYRLPAKVKLKRSKEDLTVSVTGNAQSKNFTLKAGHSPQFAFGNLIFMQMSPVGYAVDYTSQKRFYYGKSIHLNLNDTATTLTPLPDRIANRYMNQNLPSPEKGQVFAEFSLRLVNHIHMEPRNEPRESFVGMFGLSGGLSYYYRNNKFLQMGASLSTDFGPELYTTVDGAVESAYSVNFSLTDNFRFRRFTVGYGLTYAIYTWKLSNNDYTWPPNQYPEDGLHPDDLRPPLTKRSHALGITANAYHQINKYLYIGLIYSPTFYNIFPEAEYKYQHAIGLDLKYKLRLRK